MAQLTSRLLVQLVDGVSAPARKMSEAMRGIGKSMTRVNGSGVVQMQENLAKAVEKNKQAVAAMQGKMLGAVAAAYAAQKSIGGIIKPIIKFESSSLRPSAPNLRRCRPSGDRPRKRRLPRSWIPSKT